MKKYSLALLLAITSLGISAEDRRLENNGNLILENIPPIPMSIKEELSKFQNVRSAAFRGFSNTEDGVFRRDSEMLVNCTTWGVRAQQELKLHIFKNQLALHLFIQLGHQLRLPWTEVGQKMPRFIF